MRARNAAFCACLLGFVLLSRPALAQEPLSAAEFASLLADMEPRFEGSAGERSALDLIRSTALRSGWDLEVDDFSRVQHGHSFSSSLICRLPGATDDSLVLAVSLDASGHEEPVDPSMDWPMALALSLMETMASGPRPGISLEFAFLGAEHPPFDGTPAYPRGSLSLISGLPAGRRTAVLYLGPMLPSKRLFLDNQGSAAVSPFWYFKRVTEALYASGFTVSHHADLNQLFRTGLAGGDGSAAIFLGSGIPAIELRSNDGQEGAIDGMAFQHMMENFLRSFSSPDSGGFQDSWDRHYLVLGQGGRIFVLREGPFILIMLAILLGFIAFFAVSSIVIRDTFLAFMRGFLRFFLSLVFGYALCFTVIWASSLILSLWSMIGGGGLYPSSLPLPWIIAKFLFMAALSVAGTVGALSWRLLPSNLAFYGGSALFLLFFDILIFSAIDLSFSIIFAWAFVFCVLAVIFKSKALSAIFFAVTFSPLAWYAFRAAPVGGERLAQSLLGPDPLVSVILAFIVLPALLLILRIIMLFRGKDEAIAKKDLRRTLIASAIVFSTGLGVLSLADRFKGDEPQISVQAFLDADEASLRLRAESDGWIGLTELSWGGETFPLQVGRSTEEFHPYSGGAYRWKLERSSFLSRKSIVLRLEGEAPDLLGILISEAGARGIYDCTYPFTTDPGTGLTEIHIGAHPEFPLRIEMTLPEAFRGRMELAGRSRMHDAKLPGGFTLGDAVLNLRQSLDIY